MFTLLVFQLFSLEGNLQELDLDLDLDLALSYMPEAHGAKKALQFLAKTAWKIAKPGNAKLVFAFRTAGLLFLKASLCQLTPDH